MACETITATKGWKPADYDRPSVPLNVIATVSALDNGFIVTFITPPGTLMTQVYAKDCADIGARFAEHAAKMELAK